MRPMRLLHANRAAPPAAPPAGLPARAPWLPGLLLAPLLLGCAAAPDSLHGGAACGGRGRAGHRLCRAEIRCVRASRHLVVAANPLATKAGCEVLKKGGSAVDAAIATQMVLNLVEPQSSGIGGGAFMLHYSRHGTGDGLRRARNGARCRHRKLPALGQRHQRTTPQPNARPAAAASARRACCTCWTRRTRTPAD
jgi:hypothetical protein